MDKDCQSDEGLMRQAALGRRESMNILLRRYAGPLLTFLQRMIGDRHRAEELFQEVFLAVWAQRREYEYPRRFRPWLFGIAANKCHADVRRRIPIAVELSDDSPAMVPAREPSPVEAAIASETATLVAEALARLPSGQRAVMSLRIWGGLSYGEIGEACGCGESTARSQMFDGLAAVRRFLEPRLR
jgi:RNA polymerase sigma-70 factor, ECF subfamily